MNREIKFRAWHKVKNIMVYDNEDDTYGYWDGCCNSNVGMINTILNSQYYKEYEFMQYTGLHDKNGKEIWENDIVEITREGIYEKGIIIFKNGCFFIKSKETLLALYNCELNNYKVKVIGNITNNPELLGGK